MTKEMFLEELRMKLYGLPQADIEERLAFYSEMIDDRLEDGLSEEEAVAAVGSVDDVFSQIMSEIPLTRLVKERVKEKKESSTLKTVLLVVLFPIWFPLLIAAAVVIFALFVTLWAIAFSLYVTDFAIGISGLALLPVSAVYFIQGNPAGGIFIIGSGLVSIGLALLLFLACKAIAVGVGKLVKNIMLGIKSLFIGKETELS